MSLDLAFFRDTRLKHNTRYYYSTREIKLEYKGHFFDKDTMRFFNSRVSEEVYQGHGGIFFVTSERFSSETPRRYTVRQYDPKKNSIETIGAFNRLSRQSAHNLAKLYSVNGAPQK